MKTVKRHIANHSYRILFNINGRLLSKFSRLKSSILEIIRAKLIHESAKRSYNQSDKS